MTVSSRSGRFGLLLGVSLAIGCAGKEGPSGAAAYVETSVEPSGGNCAEGGVRIDAGVDANGDGLLVGSEITSTRFVCNGGGGAPGAVALVATAPEGVGDNCGAGGTRVDTGLDTDRDGTLDAAEVTSTIYVCNGVAGSNGTNGTNGTNGSDGVNGTSGTDALVATSVESPGDHCPEGGIRVEVGLDADRDGFLDAGEVNAPATTWVCGGTNGTNGTPGASGHAALVATSDEPAGGNCADGGVKIESGTDLDDDGVLGAAEVNAAATRYVCDGAGGLTGPAGVSSASAGLVVNVTAVSPATTGPIWVRFTLKDERGFPVDLNGVYSLNTVIQPRFALAYVEQDADGQVLPYVVLTKTASASFPSAQPNAFSPALAGQGTLAENGWGAGDYTYTFPSVDAPQPGAFAVAYDPTKLGQTHVLWIQASRQTNLEIATDPRGFTAVNAPYYFIPGSGGTPLVREVVSAEGCRKCHAGFKPEGSTVNAFHTGGRNDPRFCAICHNPGRTSNPAADAMVFVHRIHAGKVLQPANAFHGIVEPYPQDLRNCDACHAGALQGGQAKSRPTAAACGSCHDYVDFTGNALLPACASPVTRDASGLPVPCRHLGGAQSDDLRCALCHTPADVSSTHRPVAPPDPNNLWNGGTATSTNAAYLAADGYVPAGARVITYDVAEVTAVDDATIAPDRRPRIRFKLKSNGGDVVFQSSGAATELIPGFVGSPSVYFAFAVPEDGLSAPADFNVTVAGYLKNIWNGTAIGTGAGQLTGPDGTGYYTLTLTGVIIPANATLLTGGVGYSYSLSSTPPLTQIDLPAYPYVVATRQGGLTVPPPNVWKTATGYGSRRPIVDGARCKACHGALGVTPTFHVGQANDAPSCSFCHTPNRTISGWSSSSKVFIHALHGARSRTTAFTWHATAPGAWFDGGYPARLNDCATCHLPGTYDLSATASQAAAPNLLVTTVATGRYYANQATADWFAISPYVQADNVADYGYGFSTANVTRTLPDGTSGTQGSTTCTPATPCVCTAANPCVVTSDAGQQGAVSCSAPALCTCTTANTCRVTVKTCTVMAPCGADATTLVISPIAAACVGCHDSTIAIGHYESSGGAFYRPRADVLAPTAPKEQCLLCHALGKIAGIEAMHR